MAHLLSPCFALLLLLKVFALSIVFKAEPALWSVFFFLGLASCLCTFGESG